MLPIMLYMIVLLINFLMIWIKNLKTTKPAIILVRPQLPENIGMVARVMQNFDLTELILVLPRKGWPNKKSLDSAKSAKNIINRLGTRKI